jgi:hypothetical protein
MVIAFDHASELRATGPQVPRANVEAVLLSSGGRYLWSSTSYADDDNAYVIRPADVAAEVSGRWVLQDVVL